MVYTQARLDEALLAFRESKKYLKRRGLDTANLESHLGRKYELRKPPPPVAFRPRPALWAVGNDNDSDEEFEPASSRTKKKKKNVVSESKPARIHKRKLSVSGDDSGSSKHKRRHKSKGTTWAQGRRTGRSQKVTFKFSQSKNLRVLKELVDLHGPGAMLPLEEHVNVFNANNLDSGFLASSSGSVVNALLGRATPRKAIDSIEPLTSNDSAGSIQQSTRDLRNRSVKLDSPSVKKLSSCIRCLEQGEQCSLLESHPDYLGRCDACMAGGTDCEINVDAEPTFAKQRYSCHMCLDPVEPCPLHESNSDYLGSCDASVAGDIDCKINEDDEPRTGLATLTDVPIQDLDNCVVSDESSSSSTDQRQTCLMCIEMGEECSLLKSHPDYTGPCWVCELGDTECYITENDNPRLSSRNLHNRAEADGLQNPCGGRRYSCLTCLEQGRRCSLLISSEKYLGPCDVCEEDDTDCKIHEDGQPRMGPVTGMLFGRAIKRYMEDDDDGIEVGPRYGKRARRNSGNVDSILKYEEDPNSGIGKSMLKKKAKERENLTLINKLKDTANTGFVGGNTPALDTKLASSTDKVSSVPDSGYQISGFNNLSTPKCFDINMGNTLDTAIALTDSAPPSPSLFLPESPAAAQFDPDETEIISTSWAHPIDFRSQPRATGIPCHFCEDYRYGFLGLGRLRVEVVWDPTAKHYIEISGGHVGKGLDPTRMCTACSFERLRIRFCGHGHDGAKGNGRAASAESEQSNKSMHNHQLVEVPSWRALVRTGRNSWISQLQITKSSPEYSTKPYLPTCHLCCLPAMYRCCTVQHRNMALQPLTEGEEGRQTCGLRVCEKCKTNIEVADGTWCESEVLGVYKRADAEFLFPGSLLERVVEPYLESVGLVL